MVNNKAAVKDPDRLTARDVARFTTITALLAIFFDAAVGHGLTWENDPYWTYWITKTFLIASVFGLGTAWLGIGIARGAIITAIHTLVLTIYYWTFSPIGLPSSPEWLDLEHTWATGLPIHFGVIYLGYLVALWLWRRRAAAPEDKESAAQVGTNALLTGVATVALAGGAASWALGEFPGFTWFLVRLLITVPFLLWWWAWAGRDRLAAITGGVMLALVWATYGHFLGPIGLPDTPLRIFENVTPPATVEFLDYRQLWLISLPIYAVVASLVLLVESRRRGEAVARPAVGVAGFGIFILLIGTTLGNGALGKSGSKASINARGPVQLETGDFYSDQFRTASGDISVKGVDAGGRVSPLPPRDKLQISALLQAGNEAIQVEVMDPLVEHPMGHHTTWWGVGVDVDHHGKSGIGTHRLPSIHSEVAVFGLGNVLINGELVAAGVPVHVMTAHHGLPNQSTLELDVGMEGMEIPGIPHGHIRALWSNHQTHVESPESTRYLFGGAIMAALLAKTLILVRRQE